MFINRIKIDRYRKKFTVNRRKDTMFIGSPRGELRKVVKHALRVCVKNVRSVFVYQNTTVVEEVVGVPANVVPAVDEQYASIRFVGKPFGEDTPREARPNDQEIKHDGVRK